MLCREKEHAFSIEMRSRNHLRKVSVSNGGHDGVFIEGFLGELEELCMVEGVILELKGVNGTLRIDIKEDELRRLLSKKRE